MHWMGQTVRLCIYLHYLANARCHFGGPCRQSTVVQDQAAILVQRTISLVLGTDVLAAENGTIATYTGVISGDNTLVVGDETHLGTVILAGNNTYNQGTIVQGGILSVAADAALGALALALSGGELETTANFATARSVILASTLGRDSLFADSGTTAA